MVDFFSNDPLSGEDNSGSSVSIEARESGESGEPDFFSGAESEITNSEKKEEIENKSENEATETQSPAESQTLASKESVIKESSEVEAKTEESSEELERKIKKLSAYFEEKEINVPADAKFKIKSDKEEIEATLQDLINNYSGNKAVDKRFSDLDKERKEYKDDLEVVNKYIGEFAEKSKTDPVAALEFLAEQVGIDPLQYRRNLRSQLMQKYGEYLSMDEGQKEAFDIREENAYLKRLRETEAERLKIKQAQEELNLQYQQLEQTHGIDSDRRSKLSEELNKMGVKDITPQLLAEAHTLFGNQDRAFTVLESIDPKYTQDDSKLKTLESLLMGNPKMSDEELYSFASKLWGNDVSKAVENLQKKVPQKTDPRPQTQEAPAVSQRAPGQVDFF